ncbi:MAG: glycosyltransferase family 2 protein, partial [Pseudomonadota bacterium]
LRRACLDATGLLDEQAFPRGYGEENDLCMRARALGWTHLIDDATYIAHVRAASFKEEKQSLITAGQQVIQKRYPQYKEAVQQAFAGPALQQVRRHVQALTEMPAEQARRVRPRWLFGASAARLESPSFRQRLAEAEASGWACWVLSDAEAASARLGALVLWRLDEGSLTRVACHTPRHADETTPELTAWLVTHAIERVHVERAGGASKALI